MSTTPDGTPDDHAATKTPAAVPPTDAAPVPEVSPTDTATVPELSPTDTATVPEVSPTDTATGTPAAPAPTDAPAAPEDSPSDEAPSSPTAYPDEEHPVVLDRETLRRAPRFGRFALVAVLGGLVLGVVLGYVIFPASHPGWSRTIFAFEVMLVTLAATLLAALASDRRSRRPRRR